MIVITPRRTNRRKTPRRDYWPWIGIALAIAIAAAVYGALAVALL